MAQISLDQIKGQCHEPGRHADIRVLHMPLVGTVQHQFPLLQQDILPLHHGVQRALIHIGQLHHGVGFPGKQEALLLLLIEEGVDAVHPELMLGLPEVQLPGREHLRAVLSSHHNRGLLLKGTDPIIDPGLNKGDFIQIEMLKNLPIQTDREHRRSFSAADPGLGRGTENCRIPPAQLQHFIVLIRIFHRLCPFRQNRPKILKGKLVQILDHSCLRHPSKK